MDITVKACSQRPVFLLHTSSRNNCKIAECFHGKQFALQYWFDLGSKKIKLHNQWDTHTDTNSEKVTLLSFLFFTQNVFLLKLLLYYLMMHSTHFMNGCISTVLMKGIHPNTISTITLSLTLTMTLNLTQTLNLILNLTPKFKIGETWAEFYHYLFVYKLLPLDMYEGVCMYTHTHIHIYHTIYIFFFLQESMWILLKAIHKNPPIPNICREKHNGVIIKKLLFEMFYNSNQAT